MNRPLVTELVAAAPDFWSYLDDPELTTTWMEALELLSQDLYLDLNDLRNSKSILSCPALSHRDIGYAGVAWGATNAVHGYWRADYDGAASITLARWCDPAFTLVFVDGALLNPDSYILSGTSLRFPGIPGVVVTVICHRPSLHYSESAPRLGADSTDDITVTLEYLDITASIVSDGLVVTYPDGFVAGTVVVLNRPSGATEIAVPSATTQLTLSEPLSAVDRVYIRIGFQTGSVSVVESTLTFHGGAPCGHMVTVSENGLQESFRATSATKYALRNVYAAPSVFLYGARVDQVYTASPVLENGYVWSIDVVSDIAHSHAHAQATGSATISYVGSSPEVYANGVLLPESEYTANDGVVTLVSVSPFDVIDVWSLSNTAAAHEHVIEYRSCDGSELYADTEPYQTWLDGAQIQDIGWASENDIFKLSAIPLASDVAVVHRNPAAWKYAGPLSDPDIKSAEYLQNGVATYTVRLDSSHFTISSGILYANERVSPSWLESIYVDKYWLRDCFGVLFAHSKESSEGYRKELIGLLCAAFNNRSYSSLRNAASIMMGSDYTKESTRISIVGGTQPVATLVDEERSIELDARYTIGVASIAAAGSYADAATALDHRVSISKADDVTAWAGPTTSTPIDSFEYRSAESDGAAYSASSAYGPLLDDAGISFIHRFPVSLVGARLDVYDGSGWLIDVARISEVLSDTRVSLDRAVPIPLFSTYRIWYRHPLSPMNGWTRIDRQHPVITGDRSVIMEIPAEAVDSQPIAKFCELGAPAGAAIIPVSVIYSDVAARIRSGTAGFGVNPVPGVAVAGGPAGPMGIYIGYDYTYELLSSAEYDGITMDITVTAYP